MTFEKLKIENEDGVAIVALHRPVAKNAMSAAMLKELHDAALELRDDLSVRVVVLTGGEEFFTAGSI